MLLLAGRQGSGQGYGTRLPYGALPAWYRYAAGMADEREVGEDMSIWSQVRARGRCNMCTASRSVDGRGGPSAGAREWHCHDLWQSIRFTTMTLRYHVIYTASLQPRN